MGIPDVWVIVGLVLASIEQVNVKGRSLICWAVIAVCVGLLWHLLPGQ